MNEGELCVCKGTLLDDGAGNCVGESKHIIIENHKYVRSNKGPCYLLV